MAPIAVDEEFVMDKRCVSFLTRATWPTKFCLGDIGFVEFNPAPLLDVFMEACTGHRTGDLEVGRHPHNNAVAKGLKFPCFEGKRRTRPKENNTMVIDDVAVQLNSSALVHGNIWREAGLKAIDVTHGVEEGYFKNLTVEGGIWKPAGTDGASKSATVMLCAPCPVDPQRTTVAHKVRDMQSSVGSLNTKRHAVCLSLVEDTKSEKNF